MPCEVPRTYIPKPDTTANNLPSIPLTDDDFGAIKRFLDAVVAIIEAPETKPTLPGVILNFTGTLHNGGITLKWDAEPNSFGYVIYRGNTNVLSEARTIAVIYDGTYHLQDWFDKYGQDTASAPRYYWINGYNKAKNFGPVTGPLIKAEQT